MADVIIYRRQLEQLNSILEKFITNSAAKCALVITREGRFLTSRGTAPGFDKIALAALVSACFASTCAIANLIGESRFSTMFHQGVNEHINISSLTEEVLLIVIFNNHTTIDTVRTFTEQYKEELCVALSTMPLPTVC